MSLPYRRMHLSPIVAAVFDGGPAEHPCGRHIAPVERGCV